MRFPSSYCTDGGRAINSFEPDWPQTLTGFAKKAHEFYEKELAPLATSCARRSWIFRAACRATSASFCAGSAAGRAARAGDQRPVSA